MNAQDKDHKNSRSHEEPAFNIRLSGSTLIWSLGLIMTLLIHAFK